MSLGCNGLAVSCSPANQEVTHHGARPRVGCNFIDAHLVRACTALEEKVVQFRSGSLILRTRWSRSPRLLQAGDVWSSPFL
jgi:hypothetical protein